VGDHRERAAFMGLGDAAQCGEDAGVEGMLALAARGRMVPLVLRRTLLDGADGQPRLALHDMPSATDAVEVSP